MKMKPLLSICSAEHFYQNTEVKNSDNKYGQSKLFFFFSFFSQIIIKLVTATLKMVILLISVFGCFQFAYLIGTSY